MPTQELSEVPLCITLKDNKVFKYLSWAHPWVSVHLTQYLMTVSTQFGTLEIQIQNMTLQYLKILLLSE